jgi:hypothetical protein
LFNILLYSGFSHPGLEKICGLTIMKKINAVEMVRSIRDQQSKDTLGKTHQEIIAYFRSKAGKITKKMEKEELSKR